MEKVKLPREVVEAMEGIAKHADESLLYNIKYMHDVCENDKFDAPKFQPIYNWIQRYGHKEYFKALVIGYEVEQTPEEQVREIYDKHNGGVKGSIAWENQADIEKIVTLLGHKIKGVNA